MPKKPDDRPSTRFATAALWTVCCVLLVFVSFSVLPMGIFVLINGPLPD